MKKRVLAAAAPLLALVLLDVALRVGGVVPPRYLVGDAGTTDAPSLLVPHRGDSLVTRPEWNAHDDGLRVVRTGKSEEIKLLPTVRPGRFALRKPASTIRVVVLGGSTAFGLYVGENRAFGGVLEDLLNRSMPRGDVRVVNLAVPGWDSHRVAAVLPQILRLDPDLLLVHSGHNELLAPPAIESSAEGGAIARVHRGLRDHSVLYRWLDYWRLEARGGSETITEDEAGLRAAETLVFNAEALARERRPRPRPARIERARRAYGDNLEEIIGVARRADVPLVLVLPEPNLLMAPIRPAGDEPPGLARLLEAFRASLQQGDPAEAVALLDSAVSLAPDDPFLRYQRGLGLLILGRRGAESELERALALDTQTHRITPQLQETFLEVVERTGVPWVDTRPIFRRQLSMERAGELFIDHVHPTAEGHARIAQALFPAVRQILEDEGSVGGPSLPR